MEKIETQLPSKDARPSGQDGKGEIEQYRYLVVAYLISPCEKSNGSAYRLSR